MCLCCPPGLSTLLCIVLIPQALAFALYALINQGDYLAEYGRSPDSVLLIVGAVWVSLIYSLDRCVRFCRRCLSCCFDGGDIQLQRGAEFARVPAGAKQEEV